MKSICSLFALASATSAISLWDATGPYAVGYTKHIFNHTTPDDITKPGTFMLLTIYYPTLHQSDETLPYLDPISASNFESTIGMPNGSLSQFTTHLQFQAPTLLGINPEFTNSSSPFPTLFFSPGAGLPTVAYTAYLSDLASHGYTVVAIDHPGEPPYLPLLPRTTHPAQGIHGSPSFVDFPPSNAAAVKVQTYHESDLLTAASETFFPAFVREHGAPFNLTHFGVFGHSIGGAAAGGVMGSTSSLSVAIKFKAGANLDGSFFQYLNKTDYMSYNTSAFTPDLKRPFLELGAENHFRGKADSDASWNLFNHAQTGWLRQVQLNGTRHLDFSDIALWIARLGLPAQSNGGTWVGPLDGVRAVNLTASLLREFFQSAIGSGLDGVDEVISTTPELDLLSKGDGV